MATRMPIHECNSPHCFICLCFERIVDHHPNKWSPSPSDPEMTGDPNIAYLHKLATQTKYVHDTYEAMAKGFTVVPPIHSLLTRLCAVHRITLDDAATQKDYYLALRTAIEAEERKPVSEQNAELLAGYRSNKQAVVDDFVKDMLRLDNLARVQAVYEAVCPMALAQVQWVPGVKEDIAEYRKKHGF
jgi:hypothetical protein